MQQERANIERLKLTLNNSLTELDELRELDCDPYYYWQNIKFVENRRREWTAELAHLEERLWILEKNSVKNAAEYNRQLRELGYAPKDIDEYFRQKADDEIQERQRLEQYRRDLKKWLTDLSAYNKEAMPIWVHDAIYPPSPPVE